MKRKGVVYNKKKIALGRKMALWGSRGMNWAPGPVHERVVKASKEVLADRKTMAELGHCLFECICTQTEVTEKIFSVTGQEIAF